MLTLGKPQALPQSPSGNNINTYGQGHYISNTKSSPVLIKTLASLLIGDKAKVAPLLPTSSDPVSVFKT